jgi:hypothetical protein
VITKGDLSESVGLFNYNDFGFCQFSFIKKEFRINRSPVITELVEALTDSAGVASMSV